jgi:exodeoxyribonuclease III
MLRVLSLNITSGGRRLHRPFFARLPALAPDLVTLQELRADTAASWRGSLLAAGYAVTDTFDLARRHAIPHPARFREDGLLIASRWPHQALDPMRLDLPWPERVLSVSVAHPERALELHTVHVPNASTGIRLYARGHTELGRERLMKKLETFEGIERALAGSNGTPRLLTGDFNTPHTEYRDGRVRYWQHSCPAPLRAELASRWLDAERNVFEGLRTRGMRDAYRAVHGPEGAGFSWEHGSSKNRYRYDHVLASREFTPTACDYLHEFRLDSNHHAGILAELAGP